MENYLLHTDFTWGYQIKYPADWQKLAISPTLFGFFSPAESPNDIFQDHVRVSIDETIVSLREYIDFEISKLPSVAPTLQIGGRSALTVANLPAEQFEMERQARYDADPNFELVCDEGEARLHPDVYSRSAGLREVHAAIPSHARIVRTRLTTRLADNDGFVDVWQCERTRRRG